jgi:erythromycin esterase
LSQTDRDAVTAAVADLVTLFERREGQFVAATSAEDYAWAYRAAVNFRAVDQMFRQIPISWRPSASGARPFMPANNDIRDRQQADNLDWIVQQEGPQGKVLVFEHNIHVATALIKRDGGYAEDGALLEHVEMGTYLRRRYGARLVAIGNAVGEGLAQCTAMGRVPVEPAAPDTIDGALRQLKTPLFVLDLRTLPPETAEWLDGKRQLGRGIEAMHDIAVTKTFDAVVYMDLITPACRRLKSDGFCETE